MHRGIFQPDSHPVEEAYEGYTRTSMWPSTWSTGVSPTTSPLGSSGAFTWFMEDGMNIALTGKLGFEVADNWYLSGGFIGGFLSNVAYGGIGFGLITYGTEDNNVTLGGGYAGLAVDPGSE